MKDLIPLVLVGVLVIGGVLLSMKTVTWLGDMGLARYSVVVNLSEQDRNLLREIRDALKESKR